MLFRAAGNLLAGTETLNHERLVQRILNNDHDRNRYFVLDEGDRLVGSGGLKNIRLDDRVGEIGGLVVHPDLRGQGQGAKMLYCLEWEARSLGLRKVYAEVREDNDASLNLFRRASFEQEGLFREERFVDGRGYHIYRVAKLFD